MATVTLNCKGNHALDVLELENGTLMFRCAYNEALDLIRHEKPIKLLLELRDKKNTVFDKWQMAKCKLESGVLCNNTEKRLHEKATRYIERYEGALMMCRAMYSIECVSNVLEVYYGDGKND